MTLQTTNNRQAQTTLAEDIDDSQTSFDVDDASDLPAAPSVIQVGSELIRYDGLAGDTLSSCTRGYGSSTAAAHLEGADVYHKLTAEWFAEVQARIEALEAAGASGYEGCGVSRTTYQSINNSTGTVIDWTVEDWDNGGYFTLGGGAGHKLATIPSDGRGEELYRVQVNLGYGETMTDCRITVGLIKNGTGGTIAEQSVLTGSASGNWPLINFVDDVILDEADYIEAWTYQTDGGVRQTWPNRVGMNAKVQRLGPVT